MAIMATAAHAAEVHKIRVNKITARGPCTGVRPCCRRRRLRPARRLSDTLGRFAPLFKEHQGANIGTLSDVRIDDLIPSRACRRVRCGEA
jgi:hypothetical protein